MSHLRALAIFAALIAVFVAGLLIGALADAHKGTGCGKDKTARAHVTHAERLIDRAYALERWRREKPFAGTPAKRVRVHRRCLDDRSDRRQVQRHREAAHERFHAYRKRQLRRSSVSRRGVRFVAGWEGFFACPYRDPVGVWTIGYGTTSSDRPVGPATPCISEKTARRWLRTGLNRRYLPAVPNYRSLRQRERDALGSFAYNTGTGAVSDPFLSTLARRLQSLEAATYKGRKAIYREELPRWVNAGGRPLPGLVKRRAAEVALAVDGDYSGRP